MILDNIIIILQLTHHQNLTKIQVLIVVNAKEQV